MDLGERAVPYILSLGIKITPENFENFEKFFFWELCPVNLDRMTFGIFRNLIGYTFILYYTQWNKD